MNLFFNAMDSMFRSVESRFPNVEKRESGPAWKDKTSDEYWVSDDQVEAQDSLFGVEGEDA
jgi:hypothetical protein